MLIGNFRLLLILIFLLGWAFDADGQNVIEIGSDLATASSSDWIGQITSLTSVNSKILATEAEAGQVHVFDEQLTHLFSFGQFGRGPGDLAGPGYITAAGNYVYIHETRELRFSVFDMDGNFIRNIPQPKRPMGLEIFNNSYISIDITAEKPFYIVELAEGNIKKEFGSFTDLYDGSDQFHRFIRNRYRFRSIGPNRILILNRTSGEFFIIHLANEPILNKVFAKISNPLFTNRQNYIETYLTMTNLQQVSFPVFIEDMQRCGDGESIFVSFTGQDQNNIYQGILMKLKLNGEGRLVEAKSYLFKDRHFRNFALSQGCESVIFYDQIEGRIIQYPI